MQYKHAVKCDDASGILGGGHASLYVHTSLTCADCAFGCDVSWLSLSFVWSNIFIRAASHLFNVARGTLLCSLFKRL